MQEGIMDSCIAYHNFGNPRNWLQLNISAHLFLLVRWAGHFPCVHCNMGMWQHVNVMMRF